MSTNGQQTVTLGGVPYAVHLPDDFATRRELVVAVHRNPMRGLCAVLGMCLPDLRMSHLYERHGFDALRFGADVWRLLSRRGIEDGAIVDAALPLQGAVAELAYPSDEAVAAEVGFSSAPEGGPNSKPSKSSVSTDNPPAGSSA